MAPSVGNVGSPAPWPKDQRRLSHEASAPGDVGCPDPIAKVGRSTAEARGRGNALFRAQDPSRVPIEFEAIL